MAVTAVVLKFTALPLPPLAGPAAWAVAVAPKAALRAMVAVMAIRLWARTSVVMW
jgi:hypothetical protein